MITKSILIIVMIECFMCSIAGAFATIWNDINDFPTA